MFGTAASSNIYNMTKYFSRQYRPVRSLFQRQRCGLVLLFLAASCLPALSEPGVEPQRQQQQTAAGQWLESADEQELEAQAGNLVFNADNNNSARNLVMDMIKRAKEGSAFARLQLARMLLEGKLLQKNVMQAEFWLKQSALQQNEDAALMLAGLYYNGAEQLPRDYRRCWQLLQQIPHSQNPEALLLKGICCCYGKGRAVDAKAGFAYLQQAVDKGSEAARHFLALCYRDALGCERDYDRACEMFMQCAKQNYLPSLTQYALMLEQGHGIEADKQEAQRLLQQATQRGCPQAGWHLAKQLRPQKGLPAAKSAYMQALEQAAANGSVEAMQQLAELYANKRFKGADRQRARYWQQRHAQALPQLQ